MTAIDRLLAQDASIPKRIAFVGDTMEDVWHEGRFKPCQDDCLCFEELGLVRTPGGAAGAARQLFHWNCQANLLGPYGLPPRNGVLLGWSELNSTLAPWSVQMPVKHRYLVGDKIVWRRDQYDRYLLDEAAAKRMDVFREIEKGGYDGVLLSDYDKGFLDQDFVHAIMKICRDRSAPCVIDAKREPDWYRRIGLLEDNWAILKFNRDYALKHRVVLAPRKVMTAGFHPPCVEKNPSLIYPNREPVVCVNHVGAGDCFAAHLLLGLTHGLTLEEAATVAHAAGRVYVQHRYGRPPWPHEIRKDLDPVGGKVLSLCKSNNDLLSPLQLHALRQSASGRVVFTNGVFRIPHAGHARFLHWCRRQGDSLVVGVNSDASAARIKEGYVAPLEDRTAWLASLSSVDWVIPFDEDTPEELIKTIAPNILAKGGEYQGRQVPGFNLVKEVIFSPEFAGGHASDLAQKVRG